VALALSPHLALTWQLLGSAAYALYALAVGVSRVYLGVHHASDVVAAWLLGLSWAAIVTGFYYWQRLY
jgi:undecaprenyl-diphosphatase